MKKPWRNGLISFVLLTACSICPAFAADTVDFGRDIQPLFKAHCYECHGPKQQKNGFRLDRRRDAMRGGTIAMIGPGNSAGSRFYHRLVSDEYGAQMPPTEPLEPKQIELIKAWIDQGAKWPDELAGELPPVPPDPRASRLMELLRDGDSAGFRKALSHDPAAGSLKGQGGSTPLMYAVLYGKIADVAALLDAGADPNARNEGGATALMWAVDDLEKTRLLLNHGADANACSDADRTPLMVAASQTGSLPVVKLLLDSGAKLTVKSSHTNPEFSALREAANVGEEDVVRLLIEHGATIKETGPMPIFTAMNANDVECLDQLIRTGDREMMKIALAFVGPPFNNSAAFGNPKMIRRLLEAGAEVDARGPAGRTALMNLVNSDTLPVEIASILLEKGADPNVKSETGLTMLDYARMRGQTPVAELLVKAGAKKGDPAAEKVVTSKPASSARAALERSIPLLQQTDMTFLEKSGCVSCHNNTLTMMTVASARKSGVPFDPNVASSQLALNASYIETWRDRALQGVGIPGDADTISYILIGLAAENYPPDLATDALAHYLKNRQSNEGHWRVISHRPPLESSDIAVTAASLRAIKVYAPKSRRNEYEKPIEHATQWLKKARPTSTEDFAFQIFGLKWAGENAETLRPIAHDLLKQQRADGGWAELATLPSDAYATGQALVALKEAGILAPSDPAYRRGVEYLLSTQLEDGSWYVKSRSVPFQPYFESGFPHGKDQWISVAATNWAAMALIPAFAP
ncbi:hypothetical protein GC170_21855 [bacterium]|nr:hypothetical protein [bacterium]